MKNMKAHILIFTMLARILVIVCVSLSLYDIDSNTEKYESVTSEMKTPTTNLNIIME